MCAWEFPNFSVLRGIEVVLRPLRSNFYPKKMSGRPADTRSRNNVYGLFMKSSSPDYGDVSPLNFLPLCRCLDASRRLDIERWGKYAV